MKNTVYLIILALTFGACQKSDETEPCREENPTYATVECEYVNTQDLMLTQDPTLASFKTLDFNFNHPDSVVYLSQTDGYRRIIVLDLNSGAYETIFGGTSIADPFWMADGRIYFNNQGTLWRLYPDGSSAETTNIPVVGIERNWSRDHIIYQQGITRYVVDLDLNTEELVLPVATAPHSNWDHPDGVFVQYLDTSIAVYNSIYDEPELITIGDQGGFGLGWCDDYETIIWTNNNGIHRIPLDTKESEHIVASCESKIFIPSFWEDGRLFMDEQTVEQTSSSTYEVNSKIGYFDCPWMDITFLDLPLQ